MELPMKLPPIGHNHHTPGSSRRMVKPGSSRRMGVYGDLPVPQKLPPTWHTPLCMSRKLPPNGHTVTGKCHTLCLPGRHFVAAEPSLKPNVLM